MELSKNKIKRREQLKRHIATAGRQIEHLQSSLKHTIENKWALERELSQINTLENILSDPRTIGYDHQTGVFKVQESTDDIRKDTP